MSDVLAIIPARAGSKGIPGKNFMFLAGVSPLERAIRTLGRAGIREFVVSTDRAWTRELWADPWPDDLAFFWTEVTGHWKARPPELARDDTPMIDVVKHVLDTISGPDDQIIVLLQPTQPLREPKHVVAAIDLLTQGGRGSVVSAIEAESVDKLLVYTLDGLIPAAPTFVERRQDGVATFRLDGTVYAWRRQDGYLPRPWWPLVIPASESCPLDTPDDWIEAERRLKALGR